MIDVPRAMIALFSWLLLFELSSAHAEIVDSGPLPPGLSGFYRLLKGDKRFCDDFHLSPQRLQLSQISIGNFTFITKNTHSDVESDLDKRCRYKEITHRAERKDVLILTRINEKHCESKLRSSTRSTVQFGGKSISLVHQIDDVNPVVCEWEKK